MAHSTKKGFTMVELLIIIGITVVLASIGFSFYNRAAERRLILFKEQNKIASSLDKAKYLALSTFGQEQAPCGYGVSLDSPNNTIILFKELPVSNNDCASIDYIYTQQSDEIIETIQLDKTVKFNNATNSSLKSVVFVPPAPQIVITTINGDNSVQSASAEIVDSGGEIASSVTITKTGQITSQSGMTPTTPATNGGQISSPSPIDMGPSGPSIFDRISQ